ncbi:hypothetical protein [Natronorubrum sp. FCH18a]|uniref:hypothetical protein n=1 Tax=Natronorubrum sp. FCH18a TaxID=3447018 RepID=UPI003F51256B
MPNDTDPDASPARPTCPSCDTPIAVVTVVGPTDGHVSPCGCRVPPAALEGPRLD